MQSSLKRSSEFLFYVLGIGMLGGLILLRQGIAVDFLQPIIHSMDLPLLLIGMIFGGSAFYASIRQEKGFSPVVAIVVGLPLVLIFLIFVYLNFAMPAQETEIDPGFGEAGVAWR